MQYKKSFLLIVTTFAHVRRCCALLLGKKKEEDLIEQRWSLGSGKPWEHLIGPEYPK